MRRVAMLAVVAALSGCAAANEAADAVARDSAKSVVNTVVQDNFPGVNAAPVTDCIIDAASAGEILTIAGASVTGITASTVEQVLEIAKRPDAVQCIAQNSISLFGT